MALSGTSKAVPKATRRKPSNLEAMVSESMRSIPSDEELSGDDDDPELLNELSELSGHNNTVEESVASTTVTLDGDVNILLIERLKMYEIAETNAKAAGESSKARRFSRGIKTLKDLIKQSKAGKMIVNDDIPPPVNIHVVKPKDNVPVDITKQGIDEDPKLTPIRQAPLPPAKDEDVKIVLNDKQNEILNLLHQRKNEYKSAAITFKKTGDNKTALNYVKIVKQFDMVIEAVESGQEVDLSGMPGPPELTLKIEENIQTQENVENESKDVISEEGLITANSVSEALEQRLQVFRKQEEVAKEQGNSGKTRRMGRIVKQYEQAIKLNSAGKPIPIDELPTPPGYAPIPVPGSTLPEKQQLPPTVPKPAETAASPTSIPNSINDRSPSLKSSVSRISG